MIQRCRETFGCAKAIGEWAKSICQIHFSMKNLLADKKRALAEIILVENWFRSNFA
jgi:hypothetical protein